MQSFEEHPITKIWILTSLLIQYPKVSENTHQQVHFIHLPRLASVLHFLGNGPPRGLSTFATVYSMSTARVATFVVSLVSMTPSYLWREDAVLLTLGEFHRPTLFALQLTHRLSNISGFYDVCCESVIRECIDISVNCPDQFSSLFYHYRWCYWAHLYWTSCLE